MTEKKGPARKSKGKHTLRCGYLGCLHHKGHIGPHTWSGMIDNAVRAYREDSDD